MTILTHLLIILKVFMIKLKFILKLNIFSQRDIAKKVGLSQKAVHTIQKRLDEGLTSSPNHHLLLYTLH